MFIFNFSACRFGLASQALHNPDGDIILLEFGKVSRVRKHTLHSDYMSIDDVNDNWTDVTNNFGKVDENIACEILDNQGFSCSPDNLCLLNLSYEPDLKILLDVTAEHRVTYRGRVGWLNTYTGGEFAKDSHFVNFSKLSKEVYKHTQEELF